METLSIAERETGDPSLLISSLNLLVPPLQLFSAAMWKILQQQAVLHYGKLAQYVSLVMEAFPELLSESQRTELILGLQEFGSKTDPALEVLLWELLSALDQLLPVPDLKQTVSWLSAAPSVLEDCVQSVSYPDQLKTLLRHRRSLGQLGMNGTLSSIEEYNLSSMSRPPSHSMVYSTKLKNSKSQSESLSKSMSFFSPASPGEDVRAESVTDRTDYKGVEPRSDLSRCGDIEETGYWVSREIKDVLSDRKDEEEEEERQGVKMERENVRHEEGHRERHEQREGLVNDQVDQTDKLMKNGADSEHGQLEEEGHSTLVTSCLQKQPNMPVGQLEIASSSCPLSSPPRTIACKRGQMKGVKKGAKEGCITEQAGETDKLVKNGEELEHGQQEREEISTVVRTCLQKQPKVLIRRLEIVCTSVCAPSPCPMVKPLNANESIRQGSQDETQKKTVSQLERPLGLLPSSSGICSEGSLISPVISALNQNTGQTVEVLSQVFACSHCPFVDTEEVNLLQHIGKVHPEELSRAEGSKQTPSSAYLNLPAPMTLPTPTQSHTGTPGAHTCSQCGKSFRHFCRLQLHQRIHTGERLFSCAQCAKSFTQAEKLKQHQRVHTGERPYHCSQCGKSFTLQTTLSNHKRIHTGKRPYQCSQCGKSFTQADKLKQHQRTHTGERPYHCSQCGKSFTQQTTLSNHMRTHTGERPYQCCQCGKSFTQADKLKQHQRTHTGERPYHCSQCGKSFTQLSSMKTHQRNHTEERPYICSQCGKSFITSGDLKTHLRVHTGERPYQCPQCGKNFSQLSNMKTHQKIHTGERPYICSQCGKGYTRSDKLKLHQQTHTIESL